MDEIELRLRQLRLIQIGLIAAMVIFGWIVEIVCSPGKGEWTWRQWLVAGLALWFLWSGTGLRNRARQRSAEALSAGNRAKAVRIWHAGQFMALSIAFSVANCGLLVRMVFRGALWQASLFYATGLFLSLLWTPLRPVEFT